MKKEDWTRLLSKNVFFHNYETLSMLSTKYHFQYSNPPDLRGILLRDLDIPKGSIFSNTLFDYSELNGIDFSNSDLSGSSFKNATLTDCVFNGTNAEFSNFEGARLINCDFIETNFLGANFKDTFIQKPLFSDTIMQDIKINTESNFFIFKRLFFQKIQSGTKIRKFEQNVDVSMFTNIDNYAFQHFQKELLIDHIHKTNKYIYFLLLALCDFSRSLQRLVFWVLFVWLFFSYIYLGIPLPFINTDNCINTTIESLRPIIEWDQKNLSHPDFFYPLYLSGVVLTGLGFSDVKILNSIGRFYILIESIIGFIFLSTFVATLITPVFRYNYFETTSKAA